MPQIAGIDIDLSDRTTQIILGGGTLAGVAFLWYSGRGNGTPDAQATAASQMMPESSGDSVAGRSGVPGWVGFPEGVSGPAPAPVTPPAQQSACGAGKVAVWRDGKLSCLAAPSEAFAKQQCPPGYVAADAGTRGAKCTLATAWGNPAGPNSYIPVNLSGAYIPKYSGASMTGGQAFPGSGSVDRLYQRGKGKSATPYGTVGGIMPTPRPLTAGGHAYVKPGETLGMLARRLYGFEGWWPLLARKNGAAIANLAEGQRVRY